MTKTNRETGFCLVLDLVIVVAMIAIAALTGTAWGVVLIFALVKPGKDAERLADKAGGKGE